MNFNTIIETITKAFPRVKLGGDKGDPKLAALDRGVLTVALLVAALDGAILPEEFAAFRTLAKKCRGGTAKNVHALVDEVLPTVGGLMAMAQIGIYSEKELLEAFISSAAKALPNGFEQGSLADMRRAFALWVCAGVADGKFSHIEKAALTALEQHYAAARAEDCGCDVSSCLNKDSFRLLEPDFLKKAEKIAHDLAIQEKKAKAEAALNQLIATVETIDDRGNKVVNPSAGIAVNLVLMTMIGFTAALANRMM